MGADDSHNVRLLFRDGVGHDIAVAPHQLLLDAALEQGAPLLFQCRSGSCGSCLAQLLSGSAAMRTGVASVLLKAEAEAGLRLLCQTEAQADCTFELDYDSTASGNGPVKVQAFVDIVERIAPDVVRLKLELAEGDWFDFRPGQFVQLNVPGSDAWRSYSIASTVDDLPSIELLIRLLPEGLTSEWLRNRAKVDDVVTLQGPFGNFFLRERERAPHIMIAGGTGLAPMMSMIDTIRAQSGRKPPILLSFGCASEQGMFNLEQLDLREHWMPGLTVRLSVDSGTAGDKIRIGNPLAVIGVDDIPDPASIAYLCGPPSLIAAARDHLVALGLSPDNIHAEQFVASS